MEKAFFCLGKLDCYRRKVVFKEDCRHVLRFVLVCVVGELMDVVLFFLKGFVSCRDYFDVVLEISRLFGIFRSLFVGVVERV